MTARKATGQKGKYVSYGGRPVSAVVNGKPTGLCLDKHNLTYYYMYSDEQGKRKKKYVTRDIGTAVKKFYDFVEGNKEELIEIDKSKTKERRAAGFSKPVIMNTGIHEGGEVVVKKRKVFFLTENNKIDIPESHYFEWLLSYKGREEELKHKSGIAVKFLDTSKSPTAIRLSKILSFFEENITFKLERTKRNYVKWCKHFFTFADVPYIDDITEDILRTYEKEYLNSTREENNYAYKWKNDRAGAIKKVLSFYAEKHPSTSAKVKEIREFLMIWNRMKDKKPLNPECVTKEDYMLLYQNANLKWKAIILMSLNTMSYAKDISDMEINHIDKKRKTLKMIREKEESLKVGYLWDETIEALEEYEKVKKGDGRWLFTSNHRGKYAVASLQNYIRNFSRRIKGLSLDNITFEMFRNGASTAADDGELEYHYIEYGLGHQIGGSFTNYVRRRPERMKPVAENIYKEYGIGDIKA